MSKIKELYKKLKDSLLREEKEESEEIKKLRKQQELDAGPNRLLDVWGIYRDPEHVLDALKIILDKKDQITEDKPLRLFVNCASSMFLDGKQIRRYFDTFICSRDADIALCLSSFNHEEKEEGIISARPEDIANFLEKHKIPFRTITGKVQKEESDDPNIPEIWMVRDESALRLSLEESREKNCSSCVIYPDSRLILSMGYYLEDGTYHEEWGIKFKGIIVTDNSWTGIIDENDERNLSIEQAKRIIESEGFSYTEDHNLSDKVSVIEPKKRK